MKNQKVAGCTSLKTQKHGTNNSGSCDMIITHWHCLQATGVQAQEKMEVSHYMHIMWGVSILHADSSLILVYPSCCLEIHSTSANLDIPGSKICFNFQVAAHFSKSLFACYDSSYVAALYHCHFFCSQDFHFLIAAIAQVNYQLDLGLCIIKAKLSRPRYSTWYTRILDR